MGFPGCKQKTTDYVGDEGEQLNRMTITHNIQYLHMRGNW